MFGVIELCEMQCKYARIPGGEMVAGGLIAMLAPLLLACDATDDESAIPFRGFCIWASFNEGCDASIISRWTGDCPDPVLDDDAREFFHIKENPKKAPKKKRHR